MFSQATSLIELLAYIYVQNGAPERAESLYAALCLLQPDATAVTRALAWANIEAGHPRAALQALDGLSSGGDPGALVHLLRARAHAGLAQDEQAHAAMRAFLFMRSGVRSVEP